MRLKTFPALLFLALAVTAVRGQYLETTIDLGTGAMELLWNPTSDKVYTANYNNTVSIIDGSTNAVITTLSVPADPGALAWNQVANKVYCACGSNRVVAFDGWTNSVVANVVVSGYPTKTAFSTTSSKLYVGSDDGRLTIIDGSADTVLRTMRLQQDGNLLLMWHPLTNRLFCSTEYDTIIAIDCATDEVTSRTWTGAGGSGYVWDWCYNPVNGLAYFGGWRGVLALSAAGDSIVARVPGYVNGLRAVPSPDKLYLDGWHIGNQTAVMDCDAHAVTDSIADCLGPMVCDTVRGRVYVSYVKTADSLGVVDARTDSVTRAIWCPGSTRNAVCWNATDSRAYYATQTTLIYVVRDTTTGIAERPEAVEAEQGRPCATVGRMLEWRGAASAVLVDAGGRKVATVVPGRNDVGLLPAGVYSVVGARGVTSRFVKVR